MVWNADLNPSDSLPNLIAQIAENFALLAAGTVSATGDVHLLATVTGINGKTVGTTNLIASATARTVIDRIDLEVTAVDTITANPNVGAGVAAGEDDVVSPTTEGKLSLLTALATVGQIVSLRGSKISRVVEIGETLKLGIDTAAVGTTLTLTARVYGKTL